MEEGRRGGRTRGESRRGTSRRRTSDRRRSSGCGAALVRVGAAALILGAVILGAVFALRAVGARAGFGDWLPGRENRGPERESPVVVERETLAGAEAETEAKAGAGDFLEKMTLEEKVLQLFMVTPEALTGVNEVSAAGAKTKEAIEARPVGGIIYFRQNLQSPDQVTDMLTETKRFYEERGAAAPFLAVDEEGGQVARISGRAEFGIESFPDMSEVGAKGDSDTARKIGVRIGSYLKEMGFTMDFAPSADVLTNPENRVVARRAFSSDGETAARFSCAVAEGLRSQGIHPVLKHFPGHGGTKGDSHEGYAQTDRTLEELRAEDFVPFAEGIRGGADIIMAGHISAPEAAGDSTPASLSYRMITEILRGEMGFDGIVVTDALNMKAITEAYGSAEAAVKALEAGCDLLLMPENFEEAWRGVLNSVAQGRLTEARLDQSVRRILAVKGYGS